MITDVAAGILLRGERIFIARRAPHKAEPGKWEFPGGKRNNGEDLETCLRREIREEFSVEIVVGKKIVHSEPQGESGRYRVHFFLIASAVLPGPSSDHDTCRWILPREYTSYDFCRPDRDFMNEMESNGFSSLFAH